MDYAKPARGIAYGSTTAQSPNRCFGRLRTDNSSRKSSSKIACHVTFVDFGMDSDSRLMRLDLQGEIGKAKRIKRNHYGHNYLRKWDIRAFPDSWHDPSNCFRSCADN